MKTTINSGTRNARSRSVLRSDETDIIYAKNYCGVQRYFIADMIRDKGHLMDADRLKNWQELHKVLTICHEVLSDMHLVRNEALLFAVQTERDNYELRRQIAQLLSSS